MDVSVLYRLALTRRFFDQAQANLRRNDPQSLAIAVVNVHDGLDNFFGALATHLSVHVPDEVSMLRLFAKISGAGHSLGSPSKLSQLNAIRNDVKHHGLHPNPTTARQLVPELIAFADSLAVSFMSKSLADIHMTDAITDKGVREAMELVEQDIERGDYRNALEKMAFAIFEAYERQAFGYHRTIRAILAMRDGKPVPEFEFPEIDKTEQRLYFIELGVDPQDYESFHYLVPRVGLRAGSDTAFIIKKSRHTWHADNWTRENCIVAFDFLLRLILAQQDRPGRPAVTSIHPVDRITFIRDSAMYEDRDQKTVIATYPKGASVFVSALPFVEGNWQNLGEEMVHVTIVLGDEWRFGYVKKADIEVTADVELPAREA